MTSCIWIKASKSFASSFFFTDQKKQKGRHYYRGRIGTERVHSTQDFHPHTLAEGAQAGAGRRHEPVRCTTLLQLAITHCDAQRHLIALARCVASYLSRNGLTEIRYVLYPVHKTGATEDSLGFERGPRISLQQPFLLIRLRRANYNELIRKALPTRIQLLRRPEIQTLILE